MTHARRLRDRGLRLILSAVPVMLLASCQTNSSPSAYNLPQSAGNPLVIPVGFPKPVIPADNPITFDKVALGRQLFYDARLSKDNSVSCSSCHSQASGFSDVGHAVSTGVGGRTGTRNAPSLVNLAYDTTFFWDGRAKTLEQQAVGPILNPIEMGNDSNTVVKTLSNNAYYLSLFSKAFGDSKITMTRVAQAIASFERTLVSGNSPYDQYMRGDVSAMSQSAIRGMQLFMDTNATDCSGCHSGVNLSDGGYYSTGFQPAYYSGDQGLAALTGRQTDQGKFKTPSLRNVQLSAPYAVNGGTATLLQMVQHYNAGGVSGSNADSRIRPLNLSEGQMNDLVAFLQSLTDQDFIRNPNYGKPTTF